MPGSFGATDPDRFKDLTRIAENYWEIGKAWDSEFEDLLRSMLQFVGWREALARACADLLEGQWAEGYLGGMKGSDCIVALSTLRNRRGALWVG